MGEPWGPPKRRITKLDEWVGAWPSDIANHYIHADWYGPSPIYTQDNFQVITGNVATDGSIQSIVNSSGQVVTDSATNIYNLTGYEKNCLYNMFTSSDAAGGIIAASSATPWKVLPCAAITADGAGNIGAVADLIAAVTSRYFDIWLTMQVSVSGSHLTKWCQDPTGTPAAGSPDYLAGQTGYYVAGYPYTIHLGTLADNLGFGYDAGTNGDWPVDSIMTYSGSYRTI